jgi:hypothetical protein
MTHLGGVVVCAGMVVEAVDLDTVKCLRYANFR